MNKIFNETTRTWIYSVGVSAGAVAVFYGFMSAQELVVWLGLLATILGVTAVANIGERGVDNHD